MLHPNGVNCLDFNFSGTKLATGSSDGTINIWKPTQGTLLTSFSLGQNYTVQQAKFLGNDTTLVSASDEANSLRGQVRLTQLDSTGTEVATRTLITHGVPFSFQMP